MTRLHALWDREGLHPTRDAVADLLKLKNADLRGADLGPVDLDRLGALSGAIISRTQAERILVEVANVVVTD